jgi:hypothetical protein
MLISLSITTSRLHTRWLLNKQLFDYYAREYTPKQAVIFLVTFPSLFDPVYIST